MGAKETYHEQCPKCGKIVGYNSWFKAYYCTICGELFGGDGK